MERKTVGRGLVLASVVVACAGLFLNNLWSPKLSFFGNLSLGSVQVIPASSTSCPFGPGVRYFRWHDSLKDQDMLQQSYPSDPNWSRAQIPSLCGVWIGTRWVMMISVVMLAVGLFLLWSKPKREPA
jgi:hypothetical protein